MNKQVTFFLILILGLGFFLRIYHLNWDNNFHLQPDERFLTMVGIAIKFPSTFFQYLNPSTSTLNPSNNTYDFFVYGLLPISLTKALAILSSLTDYNGFTLLGRFLSAISDSVVIIFVFLISKLLLSDSQNTKQVPLLAALIYALFVLPIQLSHFFAVDTFLNCFLIISCYCILRFYYKRQFLWIYVSAIFYGLAIASKITAAYSLPLIFVILFLGSYSDNTSFTFRSVFKLKIIPLLIQVTVFCLLTYFVVRIADPYLFQTSNLLNPTINSTFIQAIQTLKSYDSPTAAYPPSLQWVHKTRVLFALVNFCVFGIGIPSTILLLIGIIFAFKTQKKNTPFIIINIWVVFIFLFQSFQFVQTMRYFLLLYPFVAILCGLGFTMVCASNHRKILYPLIIVFLLIWPVSFISIYTKPNTRITASTWIYNHIPTGSVLLLEHWDDGLPLPIQTTNGKTFTTKQIPVFDPDTPEKWQKINTMLNEGNYIILASGRAYNNIPTVPERYPITTKYYQDLFSGKLPYKKVAEFTSYPSLTYLGIPLTFPDDFAEEAFVVYDHPKIMIFHKD